MSSLTVTHLGTYGDFIGYLVRVESGAFSGESSFCISVDWLEDGIAALQELHHSLHGSYTFEDYDSDDFITFEMQKYGHMLISGQVGGSHRPQWLKFELLTDQAELPKIINDYSQLLKGQA